jgi:hypothetical protein
MEGHLTELLFDQTPFDRKFISPKRNLTDFFLAKGFPESSFDDIRPKKVGVIWRKYNLTECLLTEKSVGRTPFDRTPFKWKVI